MQIILRVSLLSRKYTIYDYNNLFLMFFKLIFDLRYLHYLPIIILAFNYGHRIYKYLLWYNKFVWLLHFLISFLHIAYQI